MPKSAALASLSFETAGSRRRRRAAAAFATGAALFAVGCVALQADSAAATGGRPGFLAFLASAFGARPLEPNPPQLVEIPIDPTPAVKRAKRKPLAATPLASRRPVCVRLCDGFFFPLAGSGRAGPADEQAACASQCPDASTALYFLPAGSDKIEEAYSESGARYMALASALRYRTTNDRACACHETIARTTPYWQDPTLRKGDAVMTASGFMVYRGGPHAPSGAANFTRLADAAMPRDRRAELAAIERVSLTPTRVVVRPQIAAASASPKLGAANEIRFVGAATAATN
jgi:hypothetical protein